MSNPFSIDEGARTGCQTIVIAGLTAVGFDQVGWPWALGAVAGLFAATVLILLASLTLLLVSRGSVSLASRVARLEEELQALRNGRSPPT
jgi:hypothetical protein